MAKKKKSRFRRFISWFIGKFGRTKVVPDGVEAGCRNLENDERELEGKILDAEGSGRDASDLKGELNTVRENKQILGC